MDAKIEAPRARRIPDSLPFLVRTRKFFSALFFSACILVIGVVCAAVTGLIWFLPSSRPIVILQAAATVVLVAVFVAGAVYFVRHFVASTLRGPVCGADEDGVWLRRTEFSRMALHVPWSLVRHIYPKSYVGSVIYVVVDPGLAWPAEGLTGAYADAVMKVGGPGVPVGLTGTDTRRDHMLAELGRLSGGRVRIG